MISFPSSASSFVQNYGSLFLPITADSAAFELVRRVSSVRNANITGIVAGLGVSFYFARQTSTLIGLSGIALYLAFRVIAALNRAFSIAYPHIEKDYNNLQQEFTLTSEVELDRQDPKFYEELDALADQLELQTDPIQKKWENFHFSFVTGIFLLNCHNFLFSMYDRLVEETKDLKTDQARFTKMAELLKDPHFDPDKTFGKVLFFFLRTYRLPRCKGFNISLPNLKNPERDTTTFLFLGTPSEADHNLFISGNRLEKKLNELYNETIDSLSEFLHFLSPSTPYDFFDAPISSYVVKDEQPLPGDYGNPDNPFWIRPRQANNE